MESKDILYWAYQCVCLAMFAASALLVILSKEQTNALIIGFGGVSVALLGLIYTDIKYSRWGCNCK